MLLHILFLINRPQKTECQVFIIIKLKYCKAINIGKLFKFGRFENNAKINSCQNVRLYI